VPTEQVTYYNHLMVMQATYQSLFGQLIPWTQKVYGAQTPSLMLRTETLESEQQNDKMLSDRRYVIFFAGFQPRKFEEWTGMMEDSQFLFVTENTGISTCEILYN
jgi:hypothetical protein